MLFTDRDMHAHEEFSTSLGVLPARAWARSNAPRLDLNGLWAFRFSPNPAAPLDFLNAVPESWGRIDVPSHWQLRGFGAPIYTNHPYPFPIDPPRVPDDNPTGDYVRSVEVPADWVGGRVLLRFEGVDSYGSVWVNGINVGTTGGSRLTSEFDVTDHVRPGGPNVVAVRVLQWSSNTYLEDQDMWWLSGIFRDVSLELRPAGSIGDHTVVADFEPDTGQGSLRVETDVPAVVLIDELGVSAPTNRAIPVGRVEPWSAEDPRLYRGWIVADGEAIAIAVGFRRLEIRDGMITVNGSRIQFRGVNRHDFDPDEGRVVSYETMRADIVLMKQHNVNAVRTSHYPPHPVFFDLCDELGLWVIDECDFETHGFGGEGDDAGFGNPVDDPRWTDALVDRMRRMVVRDRNHPSVLMWSIGNECGPGINIAAMAAAARESDPTRLIHYERDFTSAHVDVYSRMYLDYAEVEAIGRGQEPPLGDAVSTAHRDAQPFILAEYAHAMGNGPGGLTEYQDLFDAYPRLQGGFVWEWIDQAIRSHTGDGRAFYAYGGDFGEELHDGNFVADGLLFPDRTPSPGLRELKKVLEPIRVAPDPSGIRFTNAQDLAGTGAFGAEWILEEEGIERARGSLEVPEIAARHEAVVPLPVLPETDRETWLNVRTILAQPTNWAPAGFEVSASQWQLRDRPTEAPALPVLAPTRMAGAFDDAGRLHNLFGIDVAPPVVDLWRAPIDNDYGYYGEALEPIWRATGLHRLHQRTDAVRWSDSALEVVTRTAAAGTRFGVRGAWQWQSVGDELLLTLSLASDSEISAPLPRVGIRIGLPAAVEHVTWFGRGPGETYSDSSRAQLVGRHHSSIDALRTDYLMPQENGNRSDVRWVRFERSGEPALRVSSSTPFAFTARRWTSTDLDEARHPHDLVASDRVWLNLDASQHGLGSASCGPGVHDRYRAPQLPVRLEFRFRLEAPDLDGRTLR